jgi:hypothetical protein
VSDSASVSGGKGSSSDRFIWTVRDMGSAAKAQAFLTKTSAVLYAKDKANVTVHGAPAYFGTDGASIATVAYARGRYAFELLAPKGSSLSSAKTAALAAGAMFRDTPVR